MTNSEHHSSHFSPTHTISAIDASENYPQAPSPSRRQKSTSCLHMVFFGANVMAVAIALVWPGVARADLQPPSSAPDELIQQLNGIDSAANSRDLDRLMEYISPEFTHDDGLDYESYKAALETFWERYDTLSYSTELTGWDTDGETWTAETETTVVGLDVVGSRSGRLRSVIESRQTFSDSLLVNQSVTSEESHFTLGNNAPTIEVNLPQQIGLGQPFSFDAIVVEPLGDRVLLGAAFDEPVDPEGYITPAIVDLELLSAGGLFKTGRAPAELGDRWISAIIVRDDGITTVTRRLQVVSPDEISDDLQAD